MFFASHRGTRPSVNASPVRACGRSPNHAENDSHQRSSHVIGRDNYTAPVIGHFPTGILQMRRPHTARCSSRYGSQPDLLTGCCRLDQPFLLPGRVPDLPMEGDPQHWREDSCDERVTEIVGPP